MPPRNETQDEERGGEEDEGEHVRDMNGAPGGKRKAKISGKVTRKHARSDSKVKVPSCRGNAEKRRAGREGKRRGREKRGICGGVNATRRCGGGGPGRGHESGEARERLSAKQQHDSQRVRGVGEGTRARARAGKRDRGALGIRRCEGGVRAARPNAEKRREKQKEMAKKAVEQAHRGTNAQMRKRAGRGRR